MYVFSDSLEEKRTDSDRKVYLFLLFRYFSVVMGNVGHRFSCFWYAFGSIVVVST